MPHVLIHLPLAADTQIAARTRPSSGRAHHAAAHFSVADSGVGEPPFPMQVSKLPQTPADNDVGSCEEVLGLARDTLLRVGEVGA